MTTVQDIFAFLKAAAPLELQADFDNAGFLIGHSDSEVQTVLLSLDVTDEVTEEAVQTGAQLIVSHHPVIFHPVRSITDVCADTVKLLRLIENRIAVISMHTNLDIAEGGVNDVLMQVLGAETEGALDADGCGRVGHLPAPMVFEDFLAHCKKTLQVNGLRYVSAGKYVQRLAVMGGAGVDSMAQAAALGCDTYVTADIKYHDFLTAKELGINLIDADHFCTEDPVISDLRDRLSAAFPEVRFMKSAVHRQTVQLF